MDYIDRPSSMRGSSNVVAEGCLELCVNWIMPDIGAMHSIILLDYDDCLS